MSDPATVTVEVNSEVGGETTVKPPEEKKSPNNQETKLDIDLSLCLNSNKPVVYERSIVWLNVFLLGGLHIGALVSLYSFMYIKWYTMFFGYGLTLLASLLGITAGAHRLWSHRAYQAKLPLRILLMICNTIALQNDIYVWCRDHRGHHKFSETDADPHNSRRGFFFSHMGWLFCRKHPDVISKGATIDLSDLEEDPVVRFQRKYYHALVFLFWFALPTLGPCLLWQENPVHAFLTCVCFRYIFALHCTWMVNSAAHIFGNRPYDKNLEPRENNLVVFITFGEGYHNYHHTFPWDYSTSEFGWLSNFNFTTLVIDFFALIGQVKERKRATDEVVQKRIGRTGDGSSGRHVSCLHQLIGMLVCTFAIWFPSSLRILFNLVTHRDIFT